MLNDWQPTATLTILKQRAKILADIRHFFDERQVLEVTTPVMGQHGNPDPYTTPFVCTAHTHQDTPKYFLQTSPEFAMKRLLASGSGPIYQIAPAFRVDEYGRHHNAEFTLLEWYRTGFNHYQLMDEVDILLQFLLDSAPAVRYSYQSLFQTFLDIDPFSASMDELKKQANQQQLNVTLPNNSDDHTAWLQLLLTHCIEPKFAPDQTTFIYDFPCAQAALAQLDPNNDQIAQRFEVYIGNIELANGFYELRDAVIQEQRFQKDRQRREQLGLVNIASDHRFLQALANGLPDCSGVALGIDRLVMIATSQQHIADVITFPTERS